MNIITYTWKSAGVDHRQCPWRYPGTGLVGWYSGFQDKSCNNSLIPVDKAWNQAPGISAVTGAESLGYEREKNAYSFIAKADEFSFTINASEGNPLQNPCFEIDQWSSKQKAVILIDGKLVDEGKPFRQGVTLNQEGKEKLIIWLKLGATSKISFEISRENL
jgi:hypothetical protein